MELQCQREIFYGESLIGIELCLCQVQRAGRKVECIPMPMKDREAGLEQRSEPCWRRRIRCGYKGRPANLGAMTAGINACAECGGHQLRTQTNSKNWFTRGQPLADAINFILQKRIILLVVNADGAAKDDEKIAGLGLAQGKERRSRQQIFNLKSPLSKRRFEGAEVFKGYVTEDECAARMHLLEKSVRAQTVLQSTKSTCGAIGMMPRS